MIIVFGSLNADLVYTLSSLPKPGETLLTNTFGLFSGGKGANQAVAASQSGSCVTMFGCVGSDDHGTYLTTSINKKGVHINDIARTQTPTGSAIIYIDESTGENMIVVSPGANLDVRAAMIPDSSLTPDTTVLCQMEVPFDQNWQLIKRASARGCRTILNAAPAAQVPIEILNLLDILIVNEHEAALVSNTSDSSQKIAQKLAKSHKLLVIITLGADGVIAASPYQTWSIPALPIKTVDTTGAGDAFVGAFAAHLDQGHSVDDALVWAVNISGQTCLHKGAQKS